MKITIITVCFNSAKTIRDTIVSVLGQDYPDIEYIVVDGASNDATLDIVNEYRQKIAKVISEPDRGLYDAMNKGIAAATGDVIGILNSDDFYENDRVISTVAKVFAKIPDVDIVFGDVVFVRPTDLKTRYRHYTAGHFKPWKLRFGWMPPHPGTFIKTRLYKKVGFYSLDYKIAADFEMFVRLLIQEKASYIWINKVLIRMRIGGASTSGIARSIFMNREIVRACRSNRLYTNLALVLTKVPFKLMEFLRHL
jgi:glycosyltransferase involved in cell wall biosynthesis